MTTRKLDAAINTMKDAERRLGVLASRLDELGKAASALGLEGLAAELHTIEESVRSVGTDIYFARGKVTNG